MNAIPRTRASASLANATPVALLASLGGTAGIHAGLFAAHVDDRTGLAVSFLAASAACLAVAVALAFRPRPLARFAAALLLAGLLVAYVAFRHEPFDAVAAISKSLETVGLALALGVHRLEPAEERGTPVGIIALAFAAGLFLAGGHGH